jgi:hypothetical protein
MPTTHTVRIQGMMYHPDPITIRAGDSIVWQNRDSMEHTATFDFDARRVAAGATSDPLAFPQASGPSGFLYFCEIHPEMLGVVNVEPANLGEKGGPARPAATADAGRDAVQEFPKETWQAIAAQVAAVWVYDMADDFLKAEQVHGDADTRRVKDAWERIEQWWSAGPGGGQRVRTAAGALDETRLLAHTAADLEALGRRIRTEYRGLGRLVFQFPHPARPDDVLEPGELFAGQSSDPFGKAITVNFIPKPLQDAYMDHQNYAGAAFRIEARQDAGEPVPDAMKKSYRQMRARMSVLHYKLLAYHQVQGFQSFFGSSGFEAEKFAQGIWRMTKRGEWDAPLFVGWHWLRWIQGYLFVLDNDRVIDLVDLDAG